MTERDRHRARVYAAESLVCRIFDTADRTAGRTVELHGSTLTLPVERRFASVESVQHYLDQVLALGWVRATWPERAAVPCHGPATRRPVAGALRAADRDDRVPPHVHNRAWALRELVVLHELAHHLAADGSRQRTAPEFVDRLSTLVGEIVGPEAGVRAALGPARQRRDLAARH